MKKWLAILLLVVYTVPLAAQDAIDLSQAAICPSYPSGVAQWTVTTTLRSLVMGKDGVRVDFSKQDGPDRWPDVTPPGWTGSLQYTLWIGLPDAAGHYTFSAPIEYWYAIPADAHGDDVWRFWPDTQQYQIPKNWTYDCGAMARQPRPGEQIAFLVSAGDARKKDVALVHERSQVVLVSFPASTPAAFTFGATPLPTPTPPPAPSPMPAPAPVPVPAPLPSIDLSPVLNLMAVNQAAVLAAIADAKAVVGQKVDDFRAAVKSVWQQIGEPILKYVVPAIAAYLAGKKL